MTLPKEQINKIENLTLDILAETFGDINKLIPPIEPTTVAVKHGLEVKTGRFPDKSIIGAYEKPEKIIYVADDSYYARRSFTVAHELGHYFMHKEKEADLFNRSELLNLDEEKQTEESEANWFAASILMPEVLVRRFMTVFRTHWEIAELFGVSNSAAYFRLKNLGLID